MSTPNQSDKSASNSSPANQSEIAQSIHASDVAENLDAELVAEAVEAGQQDVADVDVKADYEASKEFSGASHADAVTPSLGVTVPAGNVSASSGAGDPADFMEMAKDVLHTEEGDQESAQSSATEQVTSQKQAAK